MAVKSLPTTTGTFPSQQAIIDQINNNPAQLVTQSKNMMASFPNATQKVAEYFAGKSMLRDQISNHVKAALSNEESKKLDDLQERLKKTIADLGNNPLASQLKTALQIAETPSALTQSTIFVYSKLIEDVFDKVTFTKISEREWIKHRPVKNLEASFTKNSDGQWIKHTPNDQKTVKNLEATFTKNSDGQWIKNTSHKDQSSS